MTFRHVVRRDYAVTIQYCTVNPNIDNTKNIKIAAKSLCRKALSPGVCPKGCGSIRDLLKKGYEVDLDSIFTINVFADRKRRFTADQVKFYIRQFVSAEYRQATREAILLLQRHRNDLENAIVNVKHKFPKRHQRTIGYNAIPNHFTA